MARKSLRTPLGILYLEANEKGLTAVSFQILPGKTERLTKAKQQQADKILDKSSNQLKRYFSGDTSALKNLPVDPQGTVFQRKVWRVLRRIPAGKTLTYGEVADRAGSPGAARAVGSACGLNPIMLVVPCHRVILSNGKLGGFSAGVRRKKSLLDHEED